jgi:hypothetical protein
MHRLHQQGEKKMPPDSTKNGRDEPSRMEERVAAETLCGDEQVERRGSLCVGSGGEEMYKRVGLLAVCRGKIGERRQVK